MLKNKQGDKYVFEVNKEEKEEVSFTKEELITRKSVLESRISKNTKELNIINSYLNEING